MHAARPFVALAILAAAAGCGAPPAEGPGADTRPETTPQPAAVAAAAATPAHPARTAGPPGRPGGARGADVILVTIDTLRYDALGANGNDRATTPVLDRLAASGRRFTAAHAHNVVTLPSHANILTGLLPYQHGVRDNGGFTVPDSVPTLAARLRDAGYATGAFVGAFPLDARFGLDRGFDVYDDAYWQGSKPDQFKFAERRGDEVVRRALSWWQAEQGRPRFLWVHLYDPHAPYAPAEPWATRYRDDPYHGEVAATDAYLSPLLSPLLDGGGPSLVLVTADHGEALGEHGELTHGLFAYEETLHVPLILWGAGVEPGVDDRTVGHVDLVPTVLDLLGLAVPSELPGRSLARDGAAVRPLYFEALSTYFNRGWAPLRGVLAGHSKMISLPIPELYDLAADPDEARNLVDEDRRRFHALRQSLPEEESWPPTARALGEEEVRQLRSLGYLASGGSRPTTFGPADDPKSLREVDALMHRTIDAYSRGDFPTAVELGRQVVAQRPTMAVGYEVLTMALRQMERHPEAIAVLEGAIRAGVDAPTLLRQYGMALADAGRPQEAVAVLEPLSADREPSTLNALGAALSEIGRHQEALAVLQRSLEIDHDDPKTHENLGIVLLRQQRPREAAAALGRALQLNDKLPIAWNTLGVAQSFLGDPVAAVEAWKRAVALDPNQLDALYNLGLTAARLGDHDTARRALDRYIAIAPPAAAADVARARQILAGLG